MSRESETTMPLKHDTPIIRKAILRVVEQKQPISPKNLYRELDKNVLATRSIKAISDMIYKLRDAGELRAIGTMRSDTRYVLPNYAEQTTLIKPPVDSKRKASQHSPVEQTVVSQETERAVATRAEAAKARAQIARFRVIFPSGWKLLAIQLDDDELDAIWSAELAYSKEQEQRERELRAELDEYRAELTRRARRADRIAQDRLRDGTHDSGRKRARAAANARETAQALRLEDNRHV